MPGLTRVIFISQARAQAMRPPRDAALISITDVDAPPAMLSESWHSVLRLSFDDVDPVDYPMEANERWVPLSDAQALEMATFVHDVAARCRRLVVQCRFGMSRSAAIAKAVCEHQRLAFPPDYTAQNDFVYRAVAWALAERAR